ncbi:ABC transporter ATP-binding protein [Paracoccus spongiarum]|uniref:Sn-glycerol-3-phosphate ABC transporter ATP-binding protein UgpC n=1 Tax=Paracoccus spongiarum TaxID=3064387 RepID=A0ABT9JG11_9RHOB|nr:sn-glycerol-3-phosphate ABC transporter ATP-binding protein UgpC [Paracoccus sp. 2205BS29-5]MDP5308748.1 sn-glycerol-3-phosphate ABC transporter ATP-binding protein UgpC [Paracoccus sp. 2205BS29-5]
MADLKLTNVAKSYGDVHVLKNINLDIRSGEFIVFVGPSGCGKSTLLRMIAGLEQITGGELQIGGQVMNDIPPSQRGIAMVFQSYALYPHMTVRDNMAFALKIAGQTKEQIQQATDRAGRMLQLTPYLDRLPKALSGGQRQRVAIGRAIVRDPKVYLFDEPLSNLDAALRVATRIEIAQLKASMPDRTMIYVTHDQTEAMTLADRIVVLAGGGIAQVGAPLELYERPVNEFVAQFIGSPAMNLLPGKVSRIGATTTVALDGGGVAHVAIPTRAGDEGMVVNVGVRPEDMRETDGEAIFEGTVDLTEALGEVTLLYFGTREEVVPVIAKLPGIHPGLNGKTVRLTADPEALHLFHKGTSLLYRDGADLPPYQPRIAAPSGSMGGAHGAASMPEGGDDRSDGRIEDGVVKPEGPVR